MVEQPEKNQEEFDLNKYLRDPNPEYKPLIAFAKQRAEQINSMQTDLRMALRTSHSETWLPKLYSGEARTKQSMAMNSILEKYKYEKFSPELENLLDEKLRDKIVTNLACGNEGAASFTMKKFEPRALISVDITKPAGINQEKGKEIVVGEDILEFVSRLPDNFESFTISGFDSHLLENKEYHLALAHELERVTAEKWASVREQSRCIIPLIAIQSVQESRACRRFGRCFRNF